MLSLPALTSRTAIQYCRICGSALGHPVVKLPNMPLTDDFLKIDEPSRQEYVQDINIFECSHCRIVQNPADFKHQTYYQHYQYSSGHSAFTQHFMASYAKAVCHSFTERNHRHAESVLEIGSGDGQQLKQFLRLGVPRLKGIEPSDYLARLAIDAGVDTDVMLFDVNVLDRLTARYDICLSSYTFDHMQNPVEYLATAHELLVDGGILALEVHDLETIIQRTEYCLFEHEHTIYLTADDARYLLENTGFSVLSINPLPSSITRGNSLIIIARKEGESSSQFATGRTENNAQLLDLNNRIQTTIQRLDIWIRQLPEQATLVGFGAGGRGIMTLASLQEYGRFAALFDSNYESNKYLTPKTRIPVIGPDQWHAYAHSHCLVYSFGYFEEIYQQLLKASFCPERIVSLLDFYPPPSVIPGAHDATTVQS